MYHELRKRGTSCNAGTFILHRNIHDYLGYVAIPAPAGSEESIAMLISIVRFLKSWKQYNATLRQLSALGDRELADIGISRSDIPRVAWDSSRD
jgi:uncharacterized protein YjiS (DUF1127 family)